MLNTIDTLLQFIAPHCCLSCDKEGALLCEACCLSEVSRRHSSCYRCNKLTDGFLTCRSCRSSTNLRAVHAYTDYDGLAKKLVHEIKFGCRRAGCGVISRLLSKTMPDDHDYVVVPIPTARRRVRQRGFDHAQLMARQIAELRALPYFPALARRGDARQVGATRMQRKAQLKGVFTVGRNVAGRHVLLVDDVMSTGTTLETAADTLRHAGAASVSAVIFARA